MEFQLKPKSYRAERLFPPSGRENNYTNTDKVGG